MIFHELWDLSSRNLLGTYETEVEALDVVGEGLATHGAAYVEELALGWADTEDPNRGSEIASRTTLADRAAPRRPE